MLFITGMFYNHFKPLNHQVPSLTVQHLKLHVMKKLIYAFGSLVLFMGCKNNNKAPLDTNKNMVLVDTTGLSKGSILTDTAKANHLTPGVTSTTSSTTTTTTTTTTSNGTGKPAAHTKSSGSSTKSSGGNTASTSSTPAPDKRDKGWSAAAKGTAIGAGSGAVIGAVVSKNKAAGAIIGGVVGGGTGYAIGRAKDRKSGRVARKRKTTY